MRSRIFLVVFFIFLTIVSSYGQEFLSFSSLSKNELLGQHRPERDYFDVTHYQLKVKIDPFSQTIQGSSAVQFIVKENTKRMQLDLSQLLTIDSIVFNQQRCFSERYHDSFFIKLPTEVQKGEQHTVTVFYHGKPIIAKQAPWDGGFVFSKDTLGNPFIGVACENIGASSWWPCKDILSDRCDSADLFFEVPNKLQAIANGKFMETQRLDSTHIFHWKVSYPIANYNVSVTVGKFEHFQEQFSFRKTTFPIDYYVLNENIGKAREQFKQVVPMLKIYQRLLGDYPFKKDGFKLVDAPYLGMEHQSAVAYGNHYQNGYNGRYFSPISKQFDFIIIHESGHEYWGNSVGMSDRSDMWINEGWCTYLELLYVEKMFGKRYTADYANYWKQVVRNQESIVNERYSNIEPSADIYYKGALLVHTLRYVLNNDRKFFRFLKKIQDEFSYQIMNTEAFIQAYNKFTKTDATAIFNVFLHQSSPAILDFRFIPNPTGKGYVFRYKWDAVEKLTMPIEFTYGKKRYKLQVTENWNEMILPDKGEKSIEIDESKAYFIVKYE